MKPWIVLSCLLCLATLKSPLLAEPISNQEAFFLRRVTAFWKDHDYPLAKQQIQQFLAAYPHSSISSHLQALLGDMAYVEQKFATALMHYDQIHQKEVFAKTAGQRADCLYQIGHYDEAISTGIEAITSQDLIPTLSPQKLHLMIAEAWMGKMQTHQDVHRLKEEALEAKSYLLTIGDKGYEDKLLSYLAYLHTVLEEFDEGAQCYLQLAKKSLPRQEDFLFKALTITQHVNPSLAIEIARDIVALSQDKKQQAAFIELQLLFQEKRFLELISRKEQLQQGVDNAHLPLLHAYLSQAYFTLHQPHDSIYHGALYLDQEHHQPGTLTLTYLNLLSCAVQIEDDLLFNHLFTQFTMNHDVQPDIACLLLSKAKRALEANRYEEAAQTVNRFAHHFPHLTEDISFLSSKATLFFQEQNWQESKKLWKAVALTSSDIQDRTQAWQQVVACSQKQLVDLGSLLPFRQELVCDLLAARPYFDLFPSPLALSSELLLGKSLFQLSQYAKAFEVLHQTTSLLDDNDAFEAYSLQLNCLKQLEAPPHQVIVVAQEALLRSFQKEPTAHIHLTLFNALLQEGDLTRAASHLDQTLSLAPHLVSVKQQRWLIDHYSQQIPSALHLQEKVISLLKQVLCMNGEDEIVFDPHQLNLEAEAFQLASYLPLEQKETTLCSLHHLQQKCSFAWKLQAEVLLELAKTCIQLKKIPEALTYLSSIKDLEAPSLLHHQSTYLTGSLLFQTLPSLDEESCQVRDLLTLFKDLQVQKTLESEPLHLEAALFYVDLRVATQDRVLKEQTALFFLQRLKDDFLAEMQQEKSAYLEARDQHLVQSELINIYLQCVDAEIMMWERKEPTDQVAHLFLQLMSHPLATPYLKERVGRCLTTLHNGLYP
ncbi:MAG: hypothetical protein QRY72_04545 [Candidatus Rhabdochlamydia sp.]